MFKKLFLKTSLFVLTTQTIAFDCQDDCSPKIIEYKTRIECTTIKSGNEESVCCKEMPCPAKIEAPQLINFTCPSGEELKNVIKKEKNLRDKEQYIFRIKGLKLSFQYDPAGGPNFSNVPFMWGDFKVSLKFDKVRFTTVSKPNLFYKIVCNYECETAKGQKTTLIVSSEFTRGNMQVFGKPTLLNGAQDKQDPEGHWYTSQKNNPGDIVFKLIKDPLL